MRVTDTSGTVSGSYDAQDRLKTYGTLSFTYNANGAGHMALYESGNDPWGDVWLYEARGCATGVAHNLRSVSNAYITIRREGL